LVPATGIEKAFAIADYPKQELEKRFGGMSRGVAMAAVLSWPACGG
jgi:hypothetical protein